MSLVDILFGPSAFTKKNVISATNIYVHSSSFSSKLVLTKYMKGFTKIVQEMEKSSVPIISEKQ